MTTDERSLANAVLDELQRQLEIVIEALEGAKGEMEAAVLAERERCAKVAEGYHDEISGRYDSETALAIAAKIREGV